MGLKNYQYNRIIREYDERQLRSKRSLQLRIDEAYHAIPELKCIDEEIISSSIQCAKRSLEDRSLSLELLKESNQCLSRKKKNLLSIHGYPDDYLEPRYLCPDCMDTGYIGTEKCHCFKQAIVDLLYGQSNLQPILQKENFPSFRLDYYSDAYVESSTGLTPRANAAKALKRCKVFLHDFDSAYSNLLIYGNTGVGKTFLANCIAKELLDTSHTVIYLTAFQLFDALEKYTFHKGEDWEESESALDYILDCDLLIIDDLGTELNNTFINSRLYLCLNERHLRQKSTMISTNLSLDDLNKTYSERIFSRITSNYAMIKLIGEDIRIKKAFS